MNILRSTFALLATALLASAQSVPTAANFWNTSGKFAGSARCVSCHPAEGARFRENTMSRALEPVAQSTILKGTAPLTFRKDPYSWSITRANDKVIYTVTNGVDTLEVPLQYAFGQGKAGQTYVFRMDGEYYESRVSYYAKLNALDLTVGAINSAPVNLKDAAGRVMKGNEPRSCFGCHTTGARVGGSLQLSDYEDGVQCEGCHGPGSAHVAAMNLGKPAPGAIRPLKHMTPQESNEFCGACHRTWDAVMLMGIKGINNARFPAYRLTNSPCFSLDDPRISCTACHNPHGPLVTEARYYDAKCTACHNSANTSIQKRVCKVGQRDCTSCHMQKVEPPEAHHAFPDHWFRVVKSKSDYPN